MRSRVAALPALPWRLEFGPKRTQIGFAGVDDEAPELPRHPSLFARDPRSLLIAVESMISDVRVSRVAVLEAHDLEQFQAAIHELAAATSVTRAVLFSGSEHLTKSSLRSAQEMLEKLMGEHDVATAPLPAIEQAPTAIAAVEAARQRRDEILAKEAFVDSAAIHVAQGGVRGAAGANNTASRLRRNGQLLGVWDGREFQHPAFQLEKSTGRVNPAVARLLALLPKDRSGWRQAFWLYQPHARLNGRRPAEAFAKDPEAVIEAARSTFEPNDTNW